MTALALISFIALDGATDGALWPLFRRWNWPNPRYQVLRSFTLRAALLYGAYLLAGPFAVALCLLSIWAAPQDTVYHVVLRWLGGDDGPLLDGEDHGHKGPIVPAIAAWMVGDDVQDEAEYRTGSVSAGLALVLAAACYDLLTLAALL